MALLVHSIGATTFTTIRTTEPFFFATGILYVYWNLVEKQRKKQGEDGAGSATAVSWPADKPDNDLFGGTIIGR